MSNEEIHMKIKFSGKEKKLNLIDDYNKFLEKCYKLFTIKENEKKNLKIYVIDEDNDNLAIENEDDFKDQRFVNEENIVTYVLELEGKIESNEKSSEYQTQDYVDDNNKKNDNTFEDNNKKNDNTFEDNNNKMNNEDKNENNNECINNNDYSKIIDLLKEENKKFRDELYEKINNLNQSNINNNNINKNTEVEKELKKTMKKSINDVKTFLMTMDEGMKKNNEQLLNTIYETKVQTQNNNNDKKLEEIKNEIINKIISLEETTNNFKKEFKNLENKFERMKEDIRKQNIIQSKKQEKEEFYGFENKNLSKNFNSSQSKGNDNNIILDSIFIDIKENLEVNYAISSEGLSDEELKDKIKRNLNNEIKEKLKSNKEEGIKKIAEIIYREVDL